MLPAVGTGRKEPRGAFIVTHRAEPSLVITAVPWMIGLLDCWMVGYQGHKTKIILDKLSEMTYQ